MGESNSRRNFMKIMASAAGAQILPGLGAKAGALDKANADGPKVFLEPFNYDGVRLLDGMQKKQCQATQDFYYGLSDDDILVGFRRRAGLPAPGNEYGGWCGGERDNPPGFKDWWMWGDTFNVFGQWLSGMARMSRATGDTALLNKATRLMNEWAKTIGPGGYFYYSWKPVTQHYIYEKTVQGMVDLCEYGGQKDAAVLLERITDWAIANLDRERKPCAPTVQDWASQGKEWYTLPENLYRAYQITGDVKYKNFADVWRYTSYWEKFRENPNPDIHGLHAYSHCNTLSSAAMAYIVHGDPKYLETIVNAYDYFERTQFYATGGYGPAEKLQAADGSLGESLESQMNTFETPCGSWAGFKLSRYLLMFTGQAKYADWIERLLYNGIGAALPMSGRGTTFYYSDYRLGGGRKANYWAAFPCCSGTYIQDVADYHNIIYYKDPTSLYVSMFVPSKVTWNYGDNEVKVEQETGFPESETTTLTVQPSRSETFNIRFRVPRWCNGATAEINNTKQGAAYAPGTWATLRRTWKRGDRVTIRLPMQLTLAPIDKQHPDRVAVMRGPVVLVRDQNPHLTLKKADLASNLVPEAKPLNFRLTNQPNEIFVPFYQMGYQQPYSMYFDVEV